MVGKNMLLIFNLDKLWRDTTNISTTFNFYADPIMVLNIQYKTVQNTAESVQMHTYKHRNAMLPLINNVYNLKDMHCTGSGFAHAPRLPSCPIR